MGVVNGVDLPSIGGTEGVGVIEQVGDALADKWTVGQRVQVSANYIFGDWVTWKGVWSEYVLCPENALIAVPDEVDDDTAAQFMVNPLTAFAMVREMQLGPGNILLQTAAGSVLGQLMIQLSKIYGFDTINLVRRQETADELKDEYGTSGAYVYDGTVESADNVKKAIAEDFPDRRIDHCIEAVGGETALFCLDLLGPDGDIYIYGSMTGSFMLTINTVADIVMKNNALKGWSTQETWIRKASEEVKRACVDELWELFSSGKLKLPATGQRFNFDQIGEAMEASFAPGRRGKIMLDCRT
jgi:NADPH:quinone reductase-like Zn-dependent oxidoreductase